MNTSAQIRARAAQHVAAVVSGRSMDALPEPSGSVQARGLLRALVYDSVRWHLRLDALLKKLLARPQQRLDPEIHALAIVGLCQLLHMDIPAHAAVAETVNAARELGRARAAGMLNAVLRRCQRESGSLLAGIDADLALRTSHPHWFVAALQADFPDDAESILAANNEHPPFWIRVNRRRTSLDEYRARLEAAALPVAASSLDGWALRLESAVDVGALPGFSEGVVSVQDAAAQLAAHLVAPRPSERILDACAAPGGKTGHLLELQPDIELIAIDISRSRLERVQQNLDRLGLRAQLVVGDAGQPQTWWDGRPFDRILLDVPCSATGVIRRHPDIKLLRRATDIAALAERQARLLEAMWPLLAPRGRIVYASCSALRAENAAVIEAFLAQEASARDVTREALAELGIDSAPGIGYRIAAGTAGMDGFYYACLEKLEG